MHLYFIQMDDTLNRITLPRVRRLALTTALLADLTGSAVRA